MRKKFIRKSERREAIKAIADEVFFGVIKNENILLQRAEYLPGKKWNDVLTTVEDLKNSGLMATGHEFVRIRLANNLANIITPKPSYFDNTM